MRTYFKIIKCCFCCAGFLDIINEDEIFVGDAPHNSYLMIPISVFRCRYFSMNTDLSLKYI